jgi:hypothetical protein
MKYRNLIILSVLLLVGCTSGTNEKDYQTLLNKVNDLENQIASQQKTIDCLNSPITQGVFFAQNSYSWSIYSIEFLTCRLIRVVSYDDYGGLDFRRYYNIQEDEPLIYHINAEIVFPDSYGYNTYIQLKNEVWPGNDFLKQLEFTIDKSTIYFGRINDSEKHRQFATFNQPDANYWPSKLP